jgi:hypothetical protein
MNRRMLATMIFLILAVVSACAGADKSAGAAAIAMPSPSISSIPVPDNGGNQPGYLYTDDSSAIFIQWTQARRTVNGQMQLFRSLERERPARTEHATFLLDGTANGRSVVLTVKKEGLLASFGFIGGRRLTGTLDGRGLNLVWPANDGTLQTTAFRRATVADYNRAVAGFRRRIQQINIVYEAEQAEARRRRAVADANKNVMDAAIDLGDAIKDANAISYADVLERYDQIWLEMQAKFKAIKEKAKPGLDSYQHTELQYALTEMNYQITEMQYEHTSLQYKLEGIGSVSDKIQVIEEASSKLTAAWQRLQQAAAANTAGEPKPFTTAEEITRATDLTRSEIKKVTAARDAAIKQAETYHKRADDLYKQAKQIVAQAKPAR